MSDQAGTTRRSFLEHLGIAGLGGLAFSGSAAEAAAEGDRPGMPQDRPLKWDGQAADLGSLYPVVQSLALENAYRLSFLGDEFDNLDAFKQVAREKLLELLLYRPEPVPPRPEVVERVDCGEFVREKVLFSTGRHFRVPAYVHVPKGLEEPAPAIVDLHSHGGMFLFGKEKVIDFGANHPTMTAYHERNYDGRPTTTALVRRGYVVVTIDALMFGERRAISPGHFDRFGWDRTKYTPEAVAEMNRFCRAKETTLVKSLVFAGLTWPGIVFWDDMRTVDYLAGRDDVDAERIGCVGISLGGYRSAYLAGLDERIAAACVVGFMSSVRPMIRRHIDTHSWVHFLPTVHRFLDLPDVVGMMAPKPLLVQQCSQDGLFPLEGMRESVDKIAAVYEKAGARGRFLGRFYDTPHRYTLAMQEEAFDWFDRHLKP